VSGHMIVRAGNEADCAAILELWRRAYGPQSPTYTEDIPPEPGPPSGTGHRPSGPA
jgi:hypothetical protein